MFPHSCRDLFSHLISRDRWHPILISATFLISPTLWSGDFLPFVPYSPFLPNVAMFAKVANFAEIATRQGSTFALQIESPDLWQKFAIFAKIAEICHFPRVHFWHPIGHLHDDVILLQGPESFSGLLSCAN